MYTATGLYDDLLMLLARSEARRLEGTYPVKGGRGRKKIGQHGSAVPKTMAVCA